MAHHHSHAKADYSRAFAFGVLLNSGFVAVEFGYGILAESLALIADAGHNLSDVVSLLLAWGASALARKAATQRRTYGFRKATVMASLASAVLLLAAIGGIAWEAVGRIVEPAPVDGVTIIVVAAIGVVINTVTALLFVRGQKSDLNLRGAFLHMAADAAVSVGVVAAGVFILLGGGLWIDPAISLVIVLVIFIGTWGLLRDSLSYAMDAVPRNIDISGIQQYLGELDRVDRIHDLHVWPLSTTEIALTVHVVVNDRNLDNSFLRDIQQHLHERFGIEHATIQVETLSADIDCMLDSGGCERYNRAP